MARAPVSIKYEFTRIDGSKKYFWINPDTWNHQIEMYKRWYDAVAYRAVSNNDKPPK
jgi:hypothetical protein